MKSTPLLIFKFNVYKKSIAGFLKKKAVFNFLIFCLSFLLFFIIFYIKKDQMDIKNLSFYQLKTAMDLTNGRLFWPGPEIPFLGHYLPGPFMSFLLLPPLLFGSSPYSSVLIWILIYLSLTYAIAVVFIRSICSNSASSFLFILLLLTSPFLSNTVLFLEWNRTFSLLFHLLILIFMYFWKDKKNEGWLPFIGLLIGLGLQLDYSILFHFITLILFLITDEKILNSLPINFEKPQPRLEEAKPFQWKYALACLTLIALPQVPYLLALNNEDILLPKPDWHQMYWFIQDFLSRPLSRLKDIAIAIDFNQERLLRLSPFLSLLFYRFLFKKEGQVSENLMNLILISISPILMVLISNNGFYFLNLGLLLLFVKYNDFLWPKHSILSGLIFSCCGLSLILPFSFILTAFLNAVLLLKVLLLWLNRSLKASAPPSGLKIFLNPLVIFTLFLSFYFSAFSHKTHKKFDGQSKQLKNLTSYIYQDTRAPHQQALSRIFTVGLKKHKNKSIAFSYLLAKEDIDKQSDEGVAKSAPPDNTDPPALKIKNSANHTTAEPQKQPFDKNRGWFIIKKESGIDYQNSNRVKEFLTQTKLPYEIKEEIKKNQLNIKNSPYPETKKYILIPYLITKKSRFPYGFHNVSHIDPSYKSHWFEKNCFLSGLFKLENHFYLCYLMDGYLEYIGIKLSFLKIRNQNFLRAEINSHPLSVIKDNRVIPHSFLKNLQLHISCLKRKEKTIPIIRRIGLSNKKSDFNKSFFAPLFVQKEISCSLKELEEIAVSFTHQRKYKPPANKIFQLKI